jgi:hypothetical protein
MEGVCDFSGVVESFAVLSELGFESISISMMDPSRSRRRFKVTAAARPRYNRRHHIRSSTDS